MKLGMTGRGKVMVGALGHQHYLVEWYHERDYNSGDHYCFNFANELRILRKESNYILKEMGARLYPLFSSILQRTVVESSFPNPFGRSIQPPLLRIDIKPIKVVSA